MNKPDQCLQAIGRVKVPDDAEAFVAGLVGRQAPLDPIAQRIAEHTNRPEEPIYADEIAGHFAGPEVNCYPGQPGARCCREAYFVALTSKKYAKGRGHLSCRQAFEKMVQHMQGHCCKYTHKAVIIADHWDADAQADWRANIERIQGEGAEVEAYVIAAGQVTRMAI